MPAESTSAGGITLLGKTPARADFIRINHGSPSALALDEWLQRNLEELVLGGQRAAPPVSFCFVPQGASEALVGSLAPSRDKAGRVFPIALFTDVPVAMSVRRPWLLPIACAPLFAQARALFDALSELDYDALKARVAAIAAPPPSAYDEAAAVAEQLLAQAAPVAWTERLFGGTHDGVAGHALAAVASAGADAAPKAVVLECPVEETVDAVLWLALASRGAKAPVSFFWTEVAPEVALARSRLLLCLSQPPAQSLLHLASPKPKPGRLLVLADSAFPAAPENAESARRHLEKLLQSDSLAAFIGAGE